MGGGLARSIAATIVLTVGCGRAGFDLLDASTTTNDVALGDTLDAITGTLVASLATLSNGSPPSARRATGAAVGSDDRVWAFGGFVGGVGAQNGLFAYTPSTGSWQSFAPSGPPAARERHTLAWDSVGSVLVAFGGYSATLTHLDELYIYQPGTNAWNQIPKTGSWPAARKDAAMVWLPSMNQMLLYGGNNGSGVANRFGDLWLLSIGVGALTGTWTALTPGGATPPKQSAPCVGYDAAARRLLLFGGQTQDTTTVATTHQYLLDTNVWQVDTPTGTVPGARAFSNCAWDPGAGRLILYGGQDSGGTPIGEIFAYDPDAKRWDALAPAMGSATPGTCGNAGATYSASLGAMFLFGGRTGGSTYTNETRVIDLAYE